MSKTAIVYTRKWHSLYSLLVVKIKVKTREHTQKMSEMPINKGNSISFNIH